MGSGSRWGAVGAGLRHAAAALSAFYLALLGWLTAIALLPALLGWTPYVITSGSMAPRIPAGTVMVASPPPAAVGPGGVIVFNDASGRTVTHRVVEVDDPGRYRTRGDANPTPDPVPVDHDQVAGVGRIVVPLIGLPAVWALEGRWTVLALALAASVAACWPVLRRLRPWRREARERAGEDRPEGQGPDGPEPGGQDEVVVVAERERGEVARRRVPTAALAGAAVAAVATAVALAGASFVAAATQPSNRWSAASTFGGLLSVTATDLPAGSGGTSQVFTFVLGSGLPQGAAVVIDLTEPYQGPVDYREAAQPVASHGQATLEWRRGQSQLREAEIVWQPPAGGMAGGVEVTITIPSGIMTAATVVEELPARATRTDTGDSLTAHFAVR